MLRHLTFTTTHRTLDDIVSGYHRTFSLNLTACLGAFLALCVAPLSIASAQGQDEASASETTAPMDQETSSLESFKQKIIGRYAHFDAVAYEQKILFMDMKTYVITYGITEFYWGDSGQVLSKSRYCHASHLSNMPFKSEVPDSFTRAIIPRDSTVLFVAQRDQSWRLFRPETPTPIGIKLDDPQEPLPQDPQDPRISDDDKDGKPGVTVKLKLYGTFDTEIYIARREIFAYDLELLSNGELAGYVRDRSEQLVVGSPLPFLRHSPSPTQHSDLTLSPMLLVPIDGDADCEEVMAHRDLLFPAEPAIW